MGQLIEMRRQALLAPDWVAKALAGSSELGRGSFATIFLCNDGMALKLTRDEATIKWSKKLATRPLRAACPVKRVGRVETAGGRETKTHFAVAMPALIPLSPWQSRSVSASYSLALIRACRIYGFSGRKLGEAREFARGIACASAEPSCGFSAEICVQLAALCLPNNQGRHLRSALFELARFCQEAKVDIDLMHPENWMASSEGQLLLTDPVVKKAYEF